MKLSHFQHVSLCLSCSIALLLSHTRSAAQEPIEVVARTGEYIPGLPDGHKIIRLSEIHSTTTGSHVWPLIDSSGSVYFFAAFNRVAPSGYADAAICKSDGVNSKVLLAERETVAGLAPDEIIRSLIPNALKVNHDGQLSIPTAIEKKDKGFVDSTLFLFAPDDSFAHIRGESPLLGLPDNTRVYRFGQAVFSNYNDDAFISSSLSSPGVGGPDSAVWRYANSVSDLEFLDDSNFELNGVQYAIDGIKPMRSTNDAGSSAFGLRLVQSGNADGAWSLFRMLENGKIEFVATEGDQISHEPNLAFDFAHQLTNGIMPDGSMISHVTLRGLSIETPKEYAIVHHRLDGAHHLIARTGRPPSDLYPGLLIQDMFPPFFNRNGDTVLYARIKSLESESLIWAVCIFSRGGEVRVIKPGDPVNLHSHGSDVRLKSIGIPSLNNSGDVAFKATLEGEGIGENNSSCIAVATCNDRIEIVLRNGDPLPINRDTPSQVPFIVRSIAFDDSTNGEGLSDNGECAALVAFGHDEMAIVKVRIPRFSPADINSDRIVNGMDLSELIGAFNTESAHADLNNDGIVDTSDLSMLISSYGQSCE